MSDRGLILLSVLVLSAPVLADDDKAPQPHQAAVLAVSFSHTGMQVVSTGADKSVVLWDVQTKRPLRRLKNNAEQFALVAFGPGVTGVIGASNTDRVLVCWDSLSFREKWRVKLAGAVNALTFSPDRERFATAHRDGSIGIRSNKTGKLIRKLEAHRGSVTSLDFSPDGNRLVSAADDGRVGWWNLHTFECEAFLTNTEQDPIELALSPSGAFLVVAWSNHSINSYPIAEDSIRPAGRLLGRHRKPVTAVSVSRDGKWIASSSADRTVAIWSADGSYVPRILRGHSDTVSDVEFAPKNCATLCSASHDGAVRFWPAPKIAEPNAKKDDPFAP